MKAFRFLRNAAFVRQLNATVTIGVLLFALLSSLLISWQGSRQIRENLLRQGGQIAENMASQSVLALLYESAENAHEAMESTMAFPDVTAVAVLQRDGKVLVMRSKALAPALAAARLDTTAVQAYLSDEDAAAWHFVAPVLAREDESQLDATQSRADLLGFVQVTQSKETLSRMQFGIVVANLLISLLFAFVLLAVLGYLSKRLTRPIMALSTTMARAEGGDMSVRAGLDGPKDIVDMASAFNSMIAALQDRERLAGQVHAIEAAHAETRIIAEREQAERERQRRFLAMLTHELKTPLSVISMCLGTAQPSPRMQGHAQNAIQDINAIIERVALTTRIEDQSLTRQIEDCRLDELLAGLIGPLDQKDRVLLELADELAASRLVTDPLLLRTALGNLLDNALKYGPAGASVRLTVSAAPGARPALLVRVENPVGPAGRPDPRQVFEKYYRAAAAHSQSGSGLGLYIVQELAELLEGQLRYLDDRPDVCFELWLPTQLPH